jgi:signal transduction histidine kinase
MFARNKLIFRLLVVVWAVIIVWQAMEHHRVTEQARTAVISRARDITGTLGLVIRSQRRFGAIVSKPRLESALKELVQSDKLKSIVLLNATGDEVVSAGEPIELTAKGAPQKDIHWGKNTVTIVNLVDLGATLQQDGTNSAPTIVLAEPNPKDIHRENWPRPVPPSDGEGPGHISRPPPHMMGSNMPPPPDMERGENGAPNGPPPGMARTNMPPSGEMRRFPGPRSGFRRPPWMSEEEYKSVIEKKGVHGLAVVLSTVDFEEAATRDLWMRLVICGFAGLSVVSFGLAWRNLVKSSELQMRLVRAREANSQLREMNVAAAGLAHETRNPLNIIRGLAQMISKAPDLPEEIRQKSVDITGEVDQVTVRLNEFINYSKPREVRRSPVLVSAVVADVVRALKCDTEDKAITLEQHVENITVNADQQLLRQALFNLLLNAIQSVEPKGRIEIATRKSGPQEACFEISDNGPGVPESQRAEIFRPYYTTREKGTGLGLAIVKQIVMVHGWEIECLANDGKGALFRVSRVELIAPKTEHAASQIASR